MIDFNNALDIWNFRDPSFLLPRSFIALITMVVILTTIGLVFWTFLAIVLESFYKKENVEKWFENISLDWKTDIIPLGVLIIAVMSWAGLWFIFDIIGLLESGGFSDGRTVAYSYLATVSISALLWFFIDPLTLISQSLVNQPNQQKNGYTKMLLSVLVGLVLYLVVSFAYAYYHTFHLAMGYDVEITSQIIISLPFFVIITVIVIFYLTIGLSGPQLAGFVMNLQSRVPDSVAEWAKRKYDKVLRGSEDKFHWYYGHVESGPNWTSLQYHYFYAYNNWRSACNGINQHEGDWEAVAVFLDNPKEEGEDYTPFGVACSQHHDGDFRFWADIHSEGTNPKIYVALGSHANYFEADNGNGYAISLFLPKGFSRTIVERIDSIVGRFRNSENGLPKEIVDGKGSRIDKWELKVLDDEYPFWVNFQGYWGKKTRHPDESGPKGPKWRRPPEDRPKTNTNENITDFKSYETQFFKNEKRLRWRLHAWKDMLLLNMLHDPDISIQRRRKALQHLQAFREQDIS